MIVRRANFREAETGLASSTQPDADVDVRLTPSTAMKGVGLWVMAGVLTHVAVRFIDSWLDRKKG